MKKVLEFIKREPVLCAGCILMGASVFFVKPSKDYLDYIDFRVLALLFCLMAVVAGLKELGAFRAAANVMSLRLKTVRGFTVLMSMVCFFLAMLITNDVALITFVPLTLLMMKGQREKDIIRTIVIETIAVNLGSMLTPIGNPQNLYLFSQGGYEVGEFLLCMLPVTAVSLVLVLVLAICSSKEKLKFQEDKTSQVKLPWLRVISYLLLFGVCLLNVFRVLDYPLVLAVVLVAILIMDRKVLLKIDYLLLLTFVVFFVFIGNLGAIPVVREMLERLIHGRELLMAVLSSQVFSNVPAAMLLSAFTSDWNALLWGVNIGGLGTLIASMASLISYKFYAAEKTAKRGKYLVIFSIYNVVLLLVLLLFAFCAFRMMPQSVLPVGEGEVATEQCADFAREAANSENIEDVSEPGKESEGTEAVVSEVTDEAGTSEPSEEMNQPEQSEKTDESEVPESSTATNVDKSNFSQPYGVFLSCDSSESAKFAQFETIVIDAEYFAREEVTALKNAGHRVFSYLNVGAVEDFRPYYDTYEYLTLSDYENWEGERWVNVSDATWKDFIVGEVAKGHLDKGVDGFFVDNCDVYYMYPTEEIYQGLTGIMQALRQTGADVIVNGGDTFVTEYLARNGEVSGIMTGANQETVFSSIDFDTESFGRQPAEEHDYFRTYVETVAAQGADVFLLEYTTDRELIAEITAYCDKKGLLYYISDSIELD